MTEARTAVADRPPRSDLARVGQGAAASLVGTGVATLAGLTTTIFLTRALGAAGYGAVAVAIAIVAIVQAFTQLGLANGATRMMALRQAEGDEAGALRMFRSALLMGAATGLLGTAVMLFLGLTGAVGGRTTAAALTVLAPLVLGSSLRAAVYGGLRAFRDLRAILVLKLAVPLVDVAVIASLVAMGFRGVPAFAAALVGLAYVDLILAAALLRRRRSVGRFTDTTLEDTKRLLAFSIPLLVTQLLYLSMQSADVLLLGALRSPAEAGLYAPVMRLLEGAPKILSAFPLLFLPIATALFARKRIGRLKELYLSVTKWGYALAFPVLLVMLVAPGEVLPLLFGGAYGEMDGVARVIALGYVAVLITGLNGVSLGVLGAVREMALYSLAGTVLNLALGFTLIPRFGAVGAAWTNTISYAAVNAAYSFLLWRRAGITPFRRDTVRLFGFSVALTALCLGTSAVAPSAPGWSLSIAAAGVAVWGAAILVGRPFAMEWSEMRQMLRRGGRGGGQEASEALDGAVAEGSP